MWLRFTLGNTYHLFLRPGMDTMEKAGGLHQFMSWDRPLLTDSGGFQVYSLANNRKLTEEGATFRSHINGDLMSFTPESVMDIQRTIGADIIMAFDECPPHPCSKEYAKTSMQRTHRWLDRCVIRLTETEPKYGFNQELFPILQGGSYEDLRKESAEYISGLMRQVMRLVVLVWVSLQRRCTRRVIWFAGYFLKTNPDI